MACTRRRDLALKLLPPSIIHVSCIRLGRTMISRHGATDLPPGPEPPPAPHEPRVDVVPVAVCGAESVISASAGVSHPGAVPAILPEVVPTITPAATTASETTVAVPPAPAPPPLLAAGEPAPPSTATRAYSKRSNIVSLLKAYHSNCRQIFLAISRIASN